MVVVPAPVRADQWVELRAPASRAPRGRRNLVRVLAGTVLRRLVQAALVVVLVGALCFAVIHLLPGDMAYRIAAGRYGYDLVDAGAASSVRRELGLDRPVLLQLADWMGRLAQGELGLSTISSRRVMDEVAEQLTYTVVLAVGAVVLTVGIGPPLGLLAGLRPGGLLDRVCLGGAVLFRALPAFVTGLLLMIVFSAQLGLLPAAGFIGASTIVLPSLSLALCLAGMSARITRDATVAAMRSPAIAFARTKGLSRLQTVWQHAIRNAAVPVITHLGVQAALLVEGVVVVETLFSWPGIGHALVHAVLGRDVPVVQGMALALAFLFVGLNLLVDLLVLAVDPRRRGA